MIWGNRYLENRVATILRISWGMLTADAVPPKSFSHAGTTRFD